MQVTPVSVADAVADELRRRLLAGHYLAGEQLRDTDLSEEFGIARPTVRVAVQMLVADGLLERGRGRSAEVRRFTASDAVDLYTLRRPIETRALELVIEGDHRLDGIALAMDRFAALESDSAWDVVADHDIGFHRAVFVAAGSPHLLRTFDDVGSEMRLLIAQLRPSYGSVADLAGEHEPMLLALKARDLSRAKSLWDMHFDESEQFFLNLIKERTL